MLTNVGWRYLVVFVASMVVYLATLCRTIYVGDSGELALAASQLQIAHPPGYPLLTLMGRVWSLICGMVRPILALNILSAIFASSAAVIFYATVEKLTTRRGLVTRTCSIGIAIAFSLSHVIWFHATSFEVHTLSALLILATYYSIERALRSGDRRFIVMSAYALGLALANHLSTLALLPAFLVFVISARRLCDVRTIVLSLFGFIIPFSSYLYLVLRSRHELLLTWYNPQTWVGFKQQVFAEAYQRYIEPISWNDLPAYFATLSSTFSDQFFLPWVLPGLVGFVVQFRRSRQLALTTATVVAVNLALNSSYGITDIEPYFIPTIVVLLIWLAELLAAMTRRSEFLSSVAALFSLAFAVAALVGNWPACNLRDNREAEIYGRELIAQIPQGGILFCGSDNSTFSTLYLRYAEKVRPDVEVYGQLPTLTKLQRDLSGGASSGWSYFPQLLSRTIERRGQAVVLARELMNLNNDFRQFGHTLYANGLIYNLSTTLAQQSPVSLSLADQVEAEITDPKLAQLYVLYSLAAAEDALRNKAETVKKYVRQAERIVLEQGEPGLHTGFVAYLMAQERIVHARRIAEAALELPNLRRSDRERVYLALARIALRLEDKETARAQFEKLLEIAPEHTEARFQMLALAAAAAVSRKELALAADLYEEMTQLAPDQYQSFYRLGTLRLQLGDTAAAISAWQHCLANGYRAGDLKSVIRALRGE